MPSSTDLRRRRGRSGMVCVPCAWKRQRPCMYIISELVSEANNYLVAPLWLIHLPLSPLLFSARVYGRCCQSRMSMQSWGIGCNGIAATEKKLLRIHCLAVEKTIFVIPRFASCHDHVCVCMCICMCIYICMQVCWCVCAWREDSLLSKTLVSWF